MNTSPPRPALAAYNSVERMLLGDFYHTSHWHEVLSDLEPFPADWLLTGIGTTNWFRRNGETIVSGTIANPSLLWSDPEGGNPLEVIDLLKNLPAADGPDLINPNPQDEPAMLSFPFLALGISDPAEKITWEAPATDDLHAWIHEKLEQENIGLAAVRFTGDFSYVHFSAAFYLPLEGLDLSNGYEASRNMKLVEYYDRHWQAGGIYAANPTLQRIISVEGLPLHLHGMETGTQHGGHLIKLQTSGVTVHIWPLKDLVMRIRNLEQSWLAVREP